MVPKFWDSGKGAFFPPLGGASIAAGYTPDAFAGAMPRHPLPLKGRGERNAEREQYSRLARISACEPLCAILQGKTASNPTREQNTVLEALWTMSRGPWSAPLYTKRKWLATLNSDGERRQCKNRVTKTKNRPFFSLSFFHAQRKGGL